MTARMIPLRETLEVEFKSDRDSLSDDQLIEALICPANAQGGVLYLGVEDDGQVTGLHIKRPQDISGLAALVANRTAPSLHIRTEILLHENLRVAALTVPRSPEVIARSDGLVKRRRIGGNGQPECVPFLPHEYPSRRADFRLVDLSAEVMADATLADFDSLQRERLRSVIANNPRSDNLAFVRMVLHEEARQHGALPVETLLILTSLREARRLSAAELSAHLQCAATQVLKLIEPLVENGLVQAHGIGRGRQYTLSPQVYKQLGQSAEYARQAGFDELQQVELIRNLLRQQTRIKREDVIALCRLSPRQAKHRLDQMVARGLLERHGEKRGSYYTAITQTGAD
jgi:predicted HTH transcriptional regulator